MKKILLTTFALVVLSGCAHKQQTADEQQALENPVHPESASCLPENPNIQQGQHQVLQPEDRIVRPDIYTDYQPERTEVLREGRYTLINFSPEEGQKYLLDQSVTVNMLGKKKRALTATVEQGLRTTLKDTGLSLCHGFGQNEPTLSTLYSRPLPKVHYQFGPMALRDALQMLAGPAYEITINDVSRTVCFKLRPAVPERATGEKPKVETTTTTTTTTEIIEE